jgi:hypothetical protein
MGFPICSSFIPLARQRLLAPTIFLPVVVFELLSWFFILKIILKKKLPGFPESFCMSIASHIIIPGSCAMSNNEDEDYNMD